MPDHIYNDWIGNPRENGQSVENTLHQKSDGSSRKKEKGVLIIDDDSDDSDDSEDFEDESTLPAAENNVINVDDDSEDSEDMSVSPAEDNRIHLVYPFDAEPKCYEDVLRMDAISAQCSHGIQLN